MNNKQDTQFYLDENWHLTIISWLLTKRCYTCTFVEEQKSQGKMSLVKVDQTPITIKSLVTLVHNV